MTRKKGSTVKRIENSQFSISPSLAEEILYNPATLIGHDTVYHLRLGVQGIGSKDGVSAFGVRCPIDQTSQL